MQYKKCSAEVCGCHKEYLSCISYSNRSDEDGCCNLYTNTEEAQAEDGEDIEREYAKRMLWGDERMKL